MLENFSVLLYLNISIKALRRRKAETLKTAPSRELKRSNWSIHFFLISNGTWTQEPSGQGKRSSQIRVRRRRPGQRNAIYIVLGVASEKAMAPHSSTLVWKIPWMEEPGRLQSMGSRRVTHDWATSLLLFTFVHWRRKWQLTPVFLPGESQGRGSLVGCHLWGRTESDTTEVTAQHQQQQQGLHGEEW